MSQVTIGICQLPVVDNKQQNIATALELIKQVASKGAQIVVLPEMFNCPYDNRYFPVYAEDENGPTVQQLAQAAARNRIVLVGGSIPERDAEDNIYNTSFVFNTLGEVIAKHRKVHLFDVEIENGITFLESQTLKPGNELTVVDTEFGKLGIAICFDIRFAEMMRLQAFKGAQMIIVPAAFNHVTGPAHWELSFRMRAVDNQLFMIGAAPAYNAAASYHAYGHSLIVNPWGKVVQQLDDAPGVIVQTIDLTDLNQIRKQLPILSAWRSDLYQLTETNRL